MPEQAQAQTAPAVPQTAAPAANLTPAETITMLRGLLDGLEASGITGPEPAPSLPEPVLPSQAGTAPGAAVTDALGVECILRSGRFWVAVGSGVSVVGSQLAGLPPITQVCLTTLGVFFMILRTMRGGR